METSLGRGDWEPDKALNCELIGYYIRDKMGEGRE